MAKASPAMRGVASATAATMAGAVPPGTAAAYGGGDYGREGYGHRDQRGGERGLWERASDEVASWFGDRDAERRRQEDYRGRGPKGYRRSDDRIREDVNDRLADDSLVDATEVEVSVSNGEVTLSGTVDSRDARRRAEDIAEGVSGVSYVQNNLRVQRGGGGVTGIGTGTGSTTTGSSGVMAAPGAGTTGTLGTGSGTGRTGTDVKPHRDLNRPFWTDCSLRPGSAGAPARSGRCRHAEGEVASCNLVIGAVGTDGGERPVQALAQLMIALLHGDADALAEIAAVAQVRPDEDVFLVLRGLQQTLVQRDGVAEQSSRSVPPRGRSRPCPWCRSAPRLPRRPASR